MAAKPDHLQVGKLSREGRFVPRDRAADGEDDRTRELSFASEEPYERWFGIEILDHGPGAADLSRLNNAGPLLLYHDTTLPVGVIEEAWVDKETRKSRALVRFGRSEAATGALRDVDDGILSHVSFAYIPQKMVLEETEKGKPDIYRVTKWLALEVSLVTVAADDTVGVGRQADDDQTYDVPIERRSTMDPTTDNTNQPVAPVPVDVKAERDAIIKAEKSRIKSINAHAGVAANVFTNAREIADTFIAEGRSFEEFAEQLPVLGERKEQSQSRTTLDLSPRDAERLRSYGLFNMIRAHIGLSGQDVGFERELSQELAKEMGRPTSDDRFFVPLSVLARTQAVGEADAGQKLVGTDHLGSEFIPYLRNRSKCGAAGATIMKGLKGNLTIPTYSAGHTAYWVAETEETTKSTPTIGQVALSPKILTAQTKLSKLLMHQSDPSAEQVAIDDMFGAVTEAFDFAALHGTATNNQPRGIAATSGIGSAVGGTTGAAPTLAHLLKLRSEVAVKNADFGSLAFMTNPLVQAKLMATPALASTDSRMVWDYNKPEALLGYRAFVTNQARSDISKGGTDDLSAIFYGNWRDLVMAMWGGVEMTVNPYSEDSAGLVRITMHLFCDIAVKRAVSFAAMLDASTV